MLGMTPSRALDDIVTALAELDVRLSGDDSPLANAWEEIKEQLQKEPPSPYWSMYLDTMRQCVGAFLTGLATDELAELKTGFKCSSPEMLERKLMQRLVARGRREKIRYAPFEFEYFCYRLLDITVYGQVLERTGLDQCNARAFSCAAPTGEYGTVSCAHIHVLSSEQFEEARAHDWPESWSGCQSDAVYGHHRLRSTRGTTWPRCCLPRQSHRTARNRPQGRSPRLRTRRRPHTC
jgi:hypothetical protein